MSIEVNRKEAIFTGKDGSTVILNDDGSAAMHTADGAWIDYAQPGPSQLDRLAADASAKAALEEWRKSRRSTPWYAPVLGAAVWIAVAAVLATVFLLGLKAYIQAGF